MQVLAHGERDLRAQDDVALHVRPAQVHVAVFQAHVFGHVHVLFHGERRRARFVQNPDLRRPPPRLRRSAIRVDGFRACAAPPCPPPRSRTPARTSSARLWTAGSTSSWNTTCGDAVAVAQVDEDHAAMVAAAVHPAHQQDASGPRRRRAGRRRCACAEGRPENPVQQKFPYRLFSVSGRGELRGNFVLRQL